MAGGGGKDDISELLMYDEAPQKDEVSCSRILRPFQPLSLYL